MSSTNSRRPDSNSLPNVTDIPLVFIDISEPATSKDRQRTRIARSHAVGVALARQRQRAQQHGENFREFTGVSKAQNEKDKLKVSKATAPFGYLGDASIDPFDTLPINARRLTTLFHSRCSICAGEPVYNVNDAIHYQSLHSVFQTGLTDGALTAALGLTMSYAAKRDFDHECITFSSVAMQQIRKKLSSTESAATPSTIGSVVLLLGIEYRLGSHQSAQAHLSGISALLELCISRKVILPASLRRAIYWQDLFSSIFVQTDRIVNYTEFYPQIASTSRHLYSSIATPKGFARNASRLGEPFMAILFDVIALYSRRTSLLDIDGQHECPELLDGMQADIEGRLHDLRRSTSDELLISCTIATFLCVFGFWTAVWNAALIPRCLSTQLLQHVRCWPESDRTGHDELLFWVLHVGKAFAIDAHVRNGLDEVAKGLSTATTILPNGGLEAEKLLHMFIWTEGFYNSEIGWFWERIDESR